MRACLQRLLTPCTAAERLAAWRCCSVHQPGCELQSRIQMCCVKGGQRAFDVVTLVRNLGTVAPLRLSFGEP